MVTGLPDYTRGVSIDAVTVSEVPINIKAQTLEKVAVDIAGQSVGNLNVNIAAQTAALDVNITASTATVDVNITNASIDVNVTNSVLTVSVENGTINVNKGFIAEFGSVYRGYIEKKMYCAEIATTGLLVENKTDQTATEGAGYCTTETSFTCVTTKIYKTGIAWSNVKLPNKSYVIVKIRIALHINASGEECEAYVKWKLRQMVDTTEIILAEGQTDTVSSTSTTWEYFDLMDVYTIEADRDLFSGEDLELVLDYYLRKSAVSSPDATVCLNDYFDSKNEDTYIIIPFGPKL